MTRGSIIIRIIVIIAIFACIPVVSAANQVNQIAASNQIVFYPKLSDEVLNNPYMGFAPDARSGPYPQPHKLVYANILWRDIEPTKGVYEFEKVEEELQLTKWAEQDTKLIFRIVMDYPDNEEHKDIPDWLYNEINGDGTWYDIDNGKGFSPNYNNPKMIDYHKKLIAKLGERYNKDPRIAFIQLGSIGHWGEWHTDESIPFPKLKITDQYVQHYVNSFPDKKLMMRRPHQIAKVNKMGLFNDMFGRKDHTDNFLLWIQQGYTSWLTQEKQPAMPDFWKYAPSGGEIADGSAGIPKYLGDAYINRTIQQAQQSHTSWLGPNVPVNDYNIDKIQKNIDSLLRIMGYRFVLVSEAHSKQVKPGSKLSVVMNWKNIGTSPFYYKWPLELSLVDATGKVIVKTYTPEDIRNWLPGAYKTTRSIQLPAKLPEGEYRLCVAIINPDIDKPGLELAIQGKRTDNRYELGKVKIKK